MAIHHRMPTDELTKECCLVACSLHCTPTGAICVIVIAGQPKGVDMTTHLPPGEICYFMWFAPGVPVY